MKMNCNIMRDLLPLYADASCSEESKKAVEEHGMCRMCSNIKTNDAPGNRRERGVTERKLYCTKGISKSTQKTPCEMVENSNLFDSLCDNISVNH